MNWFDIALVAILLITMMIGSKKGLIRELMAFFALVLGVVITTNNVDFIALEVARHINASPMVIAVISFIVMLVVLYGVFRLAGFVFYKVGDLKKSAKRDRVGGAVMGAVRGWVILGFVLFLITLLPMPGAYYRAVDESILTGPMMRTMPLLFDGTAALHPRSADFVRTIEESINETDMVLQMNHRKAFSDPGTLTQHQEVIDLALNNLDKYFKAGVLP
jgi:membrane protein required for colicin V production